MTLIIVSGTRHALSDVHRGDVESRLSQWRSRGDVTLVHGDAAGVDRLAGFIGVNWGWNVVAVPAQWQTCAAYIPRELGGCPPNPHLRTKNGRTYCPYAGHRRNQHMLDEHPGADLAVCFPAVDSGTRSGTGDFMDRAIKAGLPFQVFPLTVQRPTAPGLFSAAPVGSLPSPENAR